MYIGLYPEDFSTSSEDVRAHTISSIKIVLRRTENEQIKSNVIYNDRNPTSVPYFSIIIMESHFSALKSFHLELIADGFIELSTYIHTSNHYTLWSKL